MHDYYWGEEGGWEGVLQVVACASAFRLERKLRRAVQLKFRAALIEIRIDAVKHKVEGMPVL